MSKIITASALSDRFKEFLNQFKDEKGSYKYVEMIANYIKTNKIIEIDDKDFTKEINKIFSSQNKPTIQKAIYRAVKEIFENEVGVSATSYYVSKDKIKIKFKKEVFGQSKIENDKEEGKKETKDTRQDSKKLFDFAKNLICKTVISTYDTSKVYGLVFVNKHFETFDLNSTRSIQWLSNEYHQVDTNVIHPQDFFKNVLFALTSHAQMNGTIKEKVHTRIAQTNDAIYYDLGSSDYKAVKITKKLISLVKINENSPMFLRPTSLFEQVKPSYKNKNALDELVDLLLVKDEDKIIFKVHLIAHFLESCAVPIAIATGSAGSAKSTFTAYLKQIVDPSGKLKENNLMGFPKKIDDLVAIESHRYMMAFDNVSEIDQEISDELCRSITGGSTSGRKLYTNSDESISSYKNKICLNGIVPRLNYPDLQTRIISYPRRSLDKTNTLSEAKLEEKFHLLLPDVLGCIFKTLQKALKLFHKIDSKTNPTQRLGDFEIWGETISLCLGYKDNEFRSAYDRKLKEDTINAKESHVIVDLILSIMDGKDFYENQVKSLFNEIKSLAENEGIDIKSKYVFFPKIPNQLTRELTVVDPILKKLGFKVETFPYTKRDGVFKRNTRIVKITPRKTGGLETFLKSDLPSLSSLPPKKQSQKSSKIGKDVKTSSLPYASQNKVAGMVGISKKDAYQKSNKITPKNDVGKDGKHGKHLLQKVDDVKKEYWKCLTHNAGFFHISEETKSSGNILEFHQKQDCEIEFATKNQIF